MVFDPVHNRVLLFGGTVPSWNPNAGTVLTDLWAWDVATATWSEIVQAGPKPEPVSDFSMAFDRARNRLVIVGGYTSMGPTDTIWEWDGAAWTSIAPANGPGRRNYPPSATYDPTRQRIIVYGGSDDFHVWEWDGSSWLRRGDGLSGPPQVGVATAPTARGTLLFFGGFVYTFPRTGQASQSDTWEWNGTTGAWRKLTFTISPGPRELLGLVFDSARGRNVLFGGEFAQMAGIPVTFLGDTWEFTPPADR